MSNAQATEMMRETIRAMLGGRSGDVDDSQAQARLQPDRRAQSNTPVKSHHTDALARARLLPENQHSVVAVPAFNPDDTNSALLMYLQTDVTTPHHVALLLVLRSLLSQPAFAELRTKKQLGYVVSLSASGYGR